MWNLPVFQATAKHGGTTTLEYLGFRKKTTTTIYSVENQINNEPWSQLSLKSTSINILLEYSQQLLENIHWALKVSFQPEWAAELMLQISALDLTQAQIFGPGERKTTQPAQTTVDMSVPLEWRALLFYSAFPTGITIRKLISSALTVWVSEACVWALNHGMKTERMARSEGR